MLQRIRDRIQGWFAGVIIAIIALAFVLWGVQYYISEATGEGAEVAKVNGEKITTKQLNAFYMRILREQDQARGPLTAEQQKQLKAYALRALISKLVLVQAAQKAGFRVSMEQVRQLVMQAPAFQVKGKFSPERFQQIVYANAATPKQFFKELQHSLLINQVAVGISDSQFSLPNEIKTIYELVKQKRSFGYFLVSSKQFAQDIKISEKQVENFYKQNKRRFKTPMKVQVSYLVLSPKAISDTVTVTDKQAMQYYQGNSANFSMPASWKLEWLTVPLAQNANEQQKKAAYDKIQNIAASLKKGKNFADIASQKDSALRHKTQLLRQGEASQQLQQVLASLQPGSVSAPFQTASGYHIVKLVSQQKPGLKPFAKVKSQIKNILRQQKTQQILSDKSAQLSNLTYTNPTSLQSAAKALGLKIQTSPWITRDGVKTGLLADKKVLAAVFSSDVLQQGNNSTPIELKDGTLVVVRVSKKEKSRTKSLNEMKATIRNNLLQAAMLKKAGLVAYQIQSALQAGKTINDVENKYDVKWTSYDNIGRADHKIPAQILYAAFNIAPSNKPAVKATDAVLLKNNDYAVIVLNAIKNADYKNVSKKEQAEIARQLSAFLGHLDYALYTKGVAAQAKIEIKQQT